MKHLKSNNSDISLRVASRNNHQEVVSWLVKGFEKKPGYSLTYNQIDDLKNKFTKTSYNNPRMAAIINKTLSVVEKWYEKLVNKLLVNLLSTRTDFDEELFLKELEKYKL